MAKGLMGPWSSTVSMITPFAPPKNSQSEWDIEREELRIAA